MFSSTFHAVPDQVLQALVGCNTTIQTNKTKGNWEFFATLTRTFVQLKRVMASTGAKKVLNSPDEVVYEMLDGFVQTNPGVVRLDGFPDVSTPA
eukprot:1997682-Pyramimonas_sp.AAC.1